ncbi:hypothetical protein [Klebsiella pneumoniae ISC21]|nr:hypothetical protein [Klebsiella pneumoniae ISC21]
MLNFVKETRESGFFYDYHLPPGSARWRDLSHASPRLPAIGVR